MLDSHVPHLFLNRHFPLEPSEKLTSRGIFGSLTIVAQPVNRSEDRTAGAISFFISLSLNIIKSSLVGVGRLPISVAPFGE